MLLDHFNSEVFSCSFVDVVRDGDGRGHLAEVRDDASVQPLDAFSPDCVPVKNKMKAGLHFEQNFTLLDYN